MTRRTKPDRSNRPETAPAALRRSKARRAKKAGVTKWMASPAIAAAMAAPQVMAGPVTFFS